MADHETRRVGAAPRHEIAAEVEAVNPRTADPSVSSLDQSQIWISPTIYAPSASIWSPKSIDVRSFSYQQMDSHSVVCDVAVAVMQRRWVDGTQPTPCASFPMQMMIFH